MGEKMVRSPGILSFTSMMMIQALSTDTKGVRKRSTKGIRSYHGCYDALSYVLFFPSGELGWHMDIPKKGVTMEDVNTARVLRKARSGTEEEEEEEVGLFIFLILFMYTKPLSLKHL
jgi:hypothetical protein